MFNKYTHIEIIESFHDNVANLELKINRLRALYETGEMIPNEKEELIVAQMKYQDMLKMWTDLDKILEKFHDQITLLNGIKTNL